MQLKMHQSTIKLLQKKGFSNFNATQEWNGGAQWKAPCYRVLSKGEAADYRFKRMRRTSTGIFEEVSNAQQREQLLLFHTLGSHMGGGKSSARAPPCMQWWPSTTEMLAAAAATLVWGQGDSCCVSKAIILPCRASRTLCCGLELFHLGDCVL